MKSHFVVFGLGTVPRRVDGDNKGGENAFIKGCGGGSSESDESIYLSSDGFRTLAFYPQVAKLAELVTQWAMSRRCVLGREHSFNGVTRYHHMDPRYAEKKMSMDLEPDFLESGPGMWRELCDRFVFVTCRMRCFFLYHLLYASLSFWPGILYVVFGMS